MFFLSANNFLFYSLMPVTVLRLFFGARKSPGDVRPIVSLLSMSDSLIRDILADSFYVEARPVANFCLDATFS